MKFQNPRMQGSKHAVHQKVCKVKMPKVIKGILIKLLSEFIQQ